MSDKVMACGPADMDGEDTVGVARLLDDGSMVIAVERDGETTGTITFPAHAVSPELARWFDALRVA